MVIKSYTELHQPGIEFGLTYFDDPGVNIPSAITAWVAMSGMLYLLSEKVKKKRMAISVYCNFFFPQRINFKLCLYLLGLPDFLIRMRQASKNYQSYKLTKENTNVSNTDYISSANEIIYEHNVDNSNTQTDKKSETPMKNDEKKSDFVDQVETLTLTETQKGDPSNEDTEDMENSTNEGRGLLRYFFLIKLFV